MIELQDFAAALAPTEHPSAGAPPSPVSVGLGSSFGDNVDLDDVHSLLAEFRKGLDAQADQVSCEERYQLGVSYMEMALPSEALAEFELVLEHPALGTKALVFSVQCLSELQQPERIVALLAPRLEQETAPRSRYLELYYHLALAYESLDDANKALDAFAKVYILDPKFRDVKARLEKMTRPA